MKHLKTYEKLNKHLTEDELWKIIDSFEWQKDHDYRRIRELVKKLPENIYEQLIKFYNDKLSYLYYKYKDNWLEHPGFDIGDDSWWDLRAEVIGRGKKFYNNITVHKLEKMAKNNDYEENFGYSFYE